MIAYILHKQNLYYVALINYILKWKFIYLRYLINFCQWVKVYLICFVAYLVYENMTWLIQYMDSSKTTPSKNETAGIWIKIFSYQKLCLNTEKYMMLKYEQRGTGKMQRNQNIFRGLKDNLYLLNFLKIVYYKLLSDSNWCENNYN